MKKLAVTLVSLFICTACGKNSSSKTTTTYQPVCLKGVPSTPEQGWGEPKDWKEVDIIEVINPTYKGWFYSLRQVTIGFDGPSGNGRVVASPSGPDQMKTRYACISSNSPQGNLDLNSLAPGLTIPSKFNPNNGLIEEVLSSLNTNSASSFTKNTIEFTDLLNSFGQAGIIPRYYRNTSSKVLVITADKTVSSGQMFKMISYYSSIDEQ